MAQCAGRSTTIAFDEPLIVDPGHRFVIRVKGAERGRARIFAQAPEGWLPWFDRSEGVPGVLLTVRASVA